MKWSKKNCYTKTRRDRVFLKNESAIRCPECSSREVSVIWWNPRYQGGRAAGQIVCQCGRVSKVKLQKVACATFVGQTLDVTKNRVGLAEHLSV